MKVVDGMIYLDNASTSWPKPAVVLEAMNRFMTEVGTNPGRAGHARSLEANRIVYEARASIAKLIGLRDPTHVVFGLNATDALNLLVRGSTKKGDHVIVTSMEHNSVLRPLRDLEREGVETTIVPCSSDGYLDARDIAPAIKKNTKLIIVNHGSNVTGSIQPVREVGRLAREHGIRFAIDSAQTAGCHPMDMGSDMVDFLAFTGHKALLGPQGTGGLAIGDHLTLEDLRNVRSGGTGSRSESEGMPEMFPDKYESGTLNAVGIAGLGAGVRFVMDQGIERIHRKELALTHRLLKGLTEIDGCRIYGAAHDDRPRTSTVSVNLAGIAPADAGRMLGDEHDILVRTGLHCAPLAHRTIGTSPDGTIRLSIGYFLEDGDIDATIEAVHAIAGTHAVAGAKAPMDTGPRDGC